MLRYFSFPERSRRAHIRVFKAIGDARQLANERMRLNKVGRDSANRAFDGVTARAEQVLNLYLPQTWQGGVDEQRPRRDNL